MEPLDFVVIGAGIVGVTTAYELAAQGHEVTVLERRASVAATVTLRLVDVGRVVMVTSAPSLPAGTVTWAGSVRHAPTSRHSSRLTSRRTRNIAAY